MARLLSRRVPFFLVTIAVIGCATAWPQNAPGVSEVLMYSGTMRTSLQAPAPGISIPAGAIPSVFTETQAAAFLAGYAAFLKDPNNPATQPGLQQFVGAITNPGNYTASSSLVKLNNAVNASIATALSIIPLSSPASGLITRTDPATGAELPVSATLGPIFTERAETIGKGKFYVGFSHQDFHFTRLNGTSLNALSVLYSGGDASKSQIILPGGGALPTSAATFDVGMDVRLSQDIAFLTYGATDRLDVSLGLPLVHSAVAARTYDGNIYAGTGFGQDPASSCWCVSTFTQGSPTLQLGEVGAASQSKTGFGDLLLRVKGAVLRRPGAVVAVGTDLRFPTGDETNYLGVGAASVKPFVAVSLYSRPLRNWLVLSPHFDVAWQYTGKSILGGELQPSPISGTQYLGAPFTSTKGFIPDVFSWAVGTEVALGRRSTITVDILGNQIGWVHGIPNTVMQTLTNQALPTGPNGTLPVALNGPANQITPTITDVSGLVDGGRVSFGQYSGSFGYKARVAGALVAYFNMLVRLDNNGLVARATPLFGLGYSF
jgi:hypothetical protein